MNHQKLEINEILNALSNFENTTFFFTYPNADTRGDEIIKPIQKFINKKKRKCYYH